MPITASPVHGDFGLSSGRCGLAGEPKHIAVSAFRIAAERMGTIKRSIVCVACAAVAVPAIGIGCALMSAGGRQELAQVLSDYQGTPYRAELARLKGAERTAFQQRWRDRISAALDDGEAAQSSGAIEAEIACGVLSHEISVRTKAPAEKKEARRHLMAAANHPRAKASDRIRVWRTLASFAKHRPNRLDEALSWLDRYEAEIPALADEATDAERVLDADKAAGRLPAVAQSVASRDVILARAIPLERGDLLFQHGRYRKAAQSYRQFLRMLDTRGHPLLKQFGKTREKGMYKLALTYRKIGDLDSGRRAAVLYEQLADLASLPDHSPDIWWSPLQYRYLAVVSRHLTDDPAGGADISGYSFIHGSPAFVDDLEHLLLNADPNDPLRKGLQGTLAQNYAYQHARHKAVAIFEALLADPEFLKFKSGKNKGRLKRDLEASLMLEAAESHEAVMVRCRYRSAEWNRHLERALALYERILAEHADVKYVDSVTQADQHLWKLHYEVSASHTQDTNEEGRK